MSNAPVDLTEAFLAKVAGWEAMKHARALLSTGRVLSSNWTPPILKGVVQADDTTYRAGLVIKDTINIDNLCSCRASRQWGTLCAHSVAVGLHHLKPDPTTDDAPNPTAAPGRSPTQPGTRAPNPAPRPTATVSKDPLRLPRSAIGTPLEIHVLFPPNFAEAAARGRVMLVFEGVSQSGRTPLSTLVRRGPFRLSEADERLLARAEEVCGGDTPGMAQLTTAQVADLLPAMAGHPRLSLGRNAPLEVASNPVPIPIRATLAPTGEITLGPKPGARPPVLLASGPSTWQLLERPTRLAPAAVPAGLHEVISKPVRLSRNQVPGFLLQDWPKIAAAGGLEADFAPSDFKLEPQAPKVLLNLAGGLAQLTATLQCAYGPRIVTVGVTAKDDSHWLPDPTDPKRYGTRDLLGEHNALMRLRQSGFSGPNSQGQWQLVGQERVIAFFAREHPRLEREWTITLEERLDRSTRTHLERITPEFRALPSGEQWFDLQVSYSSDSGERFSAADIQQLLLGGGSRRLKNGKWALLDTGAVEEVQQVLLDCAPRQQSGTDSPTYRMSSAQAGFLDSTLQEQGLRLDAPPAWRDRASQQRGEARLECPPLGALKNTLRPYQKHGVAWIRFLRDNFFGGVLADEMGLGKTLQVLAHLAAVKRASPGSNLPSLVVCPTSLVFNWAAEAARFTPELRVLVLHGSQRQSLFAAIGSHDLVITSYGLVRRDLERHQALEFDTVVLDEAQHIKNRQTQNSQAVKAIRARHRLILTGTPLENSVLDLWSLFDFLMPGYLGTAQDFRERYEVPIAREKDADTLARLGRRVRPFLLRRRKTDVARELPDKIEQVAYCELTDEQAGVYQQLLSATRKEVTEAVGAQGLAKSRMLVLTALLRLRQVCCDLRLLQSGRDAESPVPGDSPMPSNATPPPQPDSAAAASGKMQLFAELLDEVLDGGHRVLVFSQFTTMLGLLREHLEARNTPFAYLDGSTTHRGAVVEKFQKDASIPVFLISLKAGGVGLNLTGADTVIHFDPWWNPAVEDQATDRAHRIGQTRVVTSYKLITRGTVEEKILNLQKRKRELIAATLTGEQAFTDGLTWEEIQDLLG